uniref:Reverse transcriptase domain-containing protein n=1 Tax=Trichobilharzia regenti TaxID=157069 RepID=A0AA85JJV8_TRIRE|nr:unnamed protein product [Trichobilharzia regenti]
MPRKFITDQGTHSIRTHAVSRVKVYGELSFKVVTTSVVRQGCSLSPFLFHFIINLLMELTLTADFSDLEIDLLPGNNPVDDIVLLLGEDPEKFQSLLDTLTSSNVRTFGMLFSPSVKCMMMLQD